MAQHLHSSCRTLHATRPQAEDIANLSQWVPRHAPHSGVFLWHGWHAWQIRLQLFIEEVPSDVLTPNYLTATAVWHMNKWMYEWLSEWMNECVCEWCEQTVVTALSVCLAVFAYASACDPLFGQFNYEMQSNFIFTLASPHHTAVYVFVSVSVSIYVPSVSWAVNCNFFCLSFCEFSFHLAVINIYAKFI